MLASSYLESASACASARAPPSPPGRCRRRVVEVVVGASFEPARRWPSLVGSAARLGTTTPTSRAGGRRRRAPAEGVRRTARRPRTASAPGRCTPRSRLRTRERPRIGGIDLPLHSFLPSTLSQSPRSMVMVAGILWMPTVKRSAVLRPRWKFIVAGPASSCTKSLDGINGLVSRIWSHYAAQKRQRRGEILGRGRADDHESSRRPAIFSGRSVSSSKTSTSTTFFRCAASSPLIFASPPATKVALRVRRARRGACSAGAAPRARGPCRRRGWRSPSAAAGARRSRRAPRRSPRRRRTRSAPRRRGGARRRRPVGESSQRAERAAAARPKRAGELLLGAAIPTSAAAIHGPRAVVAVEDVGAAGGGDEHGQRRRREAAASAGTWPRWRRTRRRGGRRGAAPPAAPPPPPPPAAPGQPGWRGLHQRRRPAARTRRRPRRWRTAGGASWSTAGWPPAASAPASAPRPRPPPRAAPSAPARAARAPRRRGARSRGAAACRGPAAPARTARGAAKTRQLERSRPVVVERIEGTARLAAGT